MKLAKAALNESSDADYLEKLERVAAAELLLNSKPELVELEQVMSSKCVKSGLVELSEMELISHLNSSKTVDDQISLANTECTRRINEHWNQVGQINASLGIYGEEDTAACAAWISANREALIALLDRDDLTEIDVSDDQYWPSFEG
ncbi:hypothetical protein [Marinomonas aquiplantarum]|uniref:hypothetical protein n=1 Tax=Marinomonas aquiplantarum TaxID=491951 RepID=UPI0015F0843E|nr:hypothetical protein [Marinomonas aquiplantarum]